LIIFKKNIKELRAFESIDSRFNILLNYRILKIEKRSRYLMYFKLLHTKSNSNYIKEYTIKERDSYLISNLLVNPYITRCAYSDYFEHYL
jgi:hypothetical protein